MSASAICCKAARVGYHAWPTATAPVAVARSRRQSQVRGKSCRWIAVWWMTGMVCVRRRDRPGTSYRREVSTAAAGFRPVGSLRCAVSRCGRDGGRKMAARAGSELAANWSAKRRPSLVECVFPGPPVTGAVGLPSSGPAELLGFRQCRGLSRTRWAAECGGLRSPRGKRPCSGEVSQSCCERPRAGGGLWREVVIYRVVHNF